MRQYLLPVWGHSRFSAAAKDFGLRMENGKVVGWWDEPPMNYGHVLISYVHWKPSYHFPKGCYVFGDSGGFSLATGRVSKIDPIDVLEWQASMCTVGCVLDSPPNSPGKNSHRIWHSGLDETLKRTERALPVYRQMRKQGTAFRWWGVLHGNTEAEVREYYEKMCAIYPFEDEGEGWAIRAEPFVNIYCVARSLRILKHLGIKKAHFLAATSQDVIAVLLALGPEAGLELLTYDSAYAVKSGFNRHIFRPNEDGLTFSIQSEYGEDTEGREWLRLKCPCAVCAHMRQRAEVVPKAQRELLQSKFGGWWSTWLQFHDLHIQERLTEAQAQFAAKDPDGLLKKILTEKEYTLVRRIFEEDGHEPKSIVKTGTSRSLFDLL